MGRVQVVLSRGGGLAKDAKVGLLLPMGVKVKSHGLRPVNAEPTEIHEKRTAALRVAPREMYATKEPKAFEKQAAALKVDPRVMYVTTGPEALIEDLPVPPGESVKIGVVFDSGSQTVSGTASRFTILERQGNVVLGGSTYILRIPAR
jgi:hypothetical protein